MSQDNSLILSPCHLFVNPRPNSPSRFLSHGGWMTSAQVVMLNGLSRIIRGKRVNMRNLKNVSYFSGTLV